MPIREFEDAAGVRWRVWSTIPSAFGHVGAKLEAWLTFESPSSRRRLSPIPPEWEAASASQLAAWCARAVEVPAALAGPVRRPTPPRHM